MKPFNFFRITCFALLLFSLGACEKDVTDQIKIDSKPKLVVTSFISPQDTVIIVKVSKTRPAIGVVSPNSTKVPDATVNLSNGSQTIRLTYDATRNIYRAKPALLPIIPNKTYSLAVSTPEGFQVSATCTVPLTEGVTFTKLEHSSKLEDFGGQVNFDRHTFNFQWRDTPGRENYYHVLSLREYRQPASGYLVRLPLDNYDEESFFSDEKRDGQLFASAAHFQMPANEPLPSPHYLRVNLSVADRHYYLYHQSLTRQEQANGNPFAEPVFLYTNIQGGLGVFAAYNQMQATKQTN